MSNVPKVEEVCKLIETYGKNKRIKTVNAISFIAKKHPLNKLIRLEIPQDKNTIDNININELLRNIILATSTFESNIGNYSEYIKFKEIYEIVKNSDEEASLKEKMLKDISLSIAENSPENEFKNNITLHTLAKKTLLVLSTKNLASVMFYNELINHLKHKTNKTYVPPNTYKKYENNSIYEKEYDRNKGFIDIKDIKDIQTKPNVDDVNMFPDILQKKQPQVNEYWEKNKIAENNVSVSETNNW